MMKNIFLAFIPLFVAVDAIRVLPIFASLTDRMKKNERFNVIIKSVITALCLAIGFVFLGKAIFKLLNITIADFMIAGGALLFCIAIIDLLSPAKKRRIPNFCCSLCTYFFNIPGWPGSLSTGSRDAFIMS